MARRAQADINIRETNPEQADPSPHHVTDIQAGNTIICLGAGWRFGLGVKEAANQMPQRVAAKGIHCQKNRI